MAVKKDKIKSPDSTLLTKNIAVNIWLSVSEAAKLCGLNTKTVRRAIQAKKIKYRIVKDRYSIDLASIIIYVYKFKKLKNKLNSFGIGQYIEKWKE
jgi:excisionase family DNA binding protein